jgi:hypothetical protein
MNLAEMIAQFSEDAKVDAKIAKQIIDKLAENNLSVEKMNSVIRRLKDYFVKNEYWSFLSKLKDETVQKVIEEMITDEIRRAMQSVGEPVECTEDVSFRTFAEFNEEWKEYKAGDEVKIQIMRVGEWNHPQYWKVTVTKDTIKDVVKNFKNRERWIDLAVDENHEWNHRSLARFKDLYQEGKDALFAVLKLTKKGAELLTEGAYKYFSPEIVFSKTDEETWKIQKNLLLWGAFTNRPFFKNMQPMFANEAADTETSADSSSSILLFKNHWPMKTLLELLSQFAESQTISEEWKVQLSELRSNLPQEDQTEDLKFHVDEALAFNASEEDATDADAEETTDADADADAEETTDAEDSAEETTEDAVEVPAELNVQANEAWIYQFDESQMQVMKWIISQATKAITAARREKITASVGAFAFNETTKKWFILPKDTQTVVDFALSLNESQSEKFLKIMKWFKVLSAGEVGHSQDKAITSSEDAAMKKYFTETLKLTSEEAEIALKLAKSKK